MSLSTQYKKWLAGVVLQRQLLKLQPGAQAVGGTTLPRFLSL